MAEAEERRAEYYRQTAEEITRLAEKTQDAAIRKELLELAERFRRLAAGIQRREQSSGEPT